MDQNSSGNHEKGLGLWNPTYLGFNISLAIEQLCDLYLKRVESQCSLLHRGVWRMRTSENVYEGPHTQWVLSGFYTLVSQLPVQCSCYSPTKQRP